METKGLIYSAANYRKQKIRVIVGYGTQINVDCTLL